MKRKTMLTIGCLLLSATMLTACTTPSQKISFAPYWYRNAITPSDQDQQVVETLTYAVTFSPSDSWTNYEVNYTNGVYTTKLSVDNEKYGKSVYKYETALSIDVAYTFGTVNSETFHDTVTSCVYFEKEGNGLTPIYSEKTFSNHSLSNVDMTLEEIQLLNYSVTVDYQSMVSTVTNNDEPNRPNQKTFKVEDTDKYTWLDNETLLFALRGVNPSSAVSHKVLVYAPFSEETQTITATFSAPQEKQFSFVDNGEEKTNKKLTYTSVSLAIDSSTPGQTQTVLIAHASDVQANEMRNVILSYQAPIAYNLGTLVYTLKNIERN